MKEGPCISRVAALIDDRARAKVLTALMADRALTAVELAGIGGVTKETISAHLATLIDAGLVVIDHQGRHHYFRLANRDVAQLLESLMGIAFRIGEVRLRSSPREPDLRKARVCYSHLAGELGVVAYEALLHQRSFDLNNDGLALTRAGAEWFTSFGVDVAAAEQRRVICRRCLDWTERRHHLGGSLGIALLTRLYELGWASKAVDTRVIKFTLQGEQNFRSLFSSRQTERIEK